MLKTTLVLEDQSRQQMIKVWKWCELWLLKTAVLVSGWLQDRQLITSSRKMSWNDFENVSSESERTSQSTGGCPHDNAPAHTALSIREFLVKKNIPVLPHPPYGPDLAPCNFCLFCNLKLRLKGHHFRDDGKHTKSCNRWATHTYKKWLPVPLWSVGKKVGTIV